jgi:xanthine dehydrogenase YagR molybdenum-binding subunit
VLAQVAADELAVAAGLVRVEMGDSDLPPAPPSVGQRTAASVAPAVRAAAAALRELIIADAVADDRSPLAGLAPDRVAAPAAGS